MDKQLRDKIKKIETKYKEELSKKRYEIKCLKAHLSKLDGKENKK